MSKQPDPSTLVDGVLAAAAHLEPELEEALAEHHLSRPSFQVLSALLDAEGHALTQRELMAQVRRTSGTMSVRLARLERAGLVTREPDAEDRRSVTVTLTDSGRELVEAARPSYDQAAQRLAAGPARRRARDLRASSSPPGWASSSPTTASPRAWASRWLPPRSPRVCAARSDCPTATASSS